LVNDRRLTRVYAAVAPQVSGEAAHGMIQASHNDYVLDRWIGSYG